MRRTMNRVDLIPLLKKLWAWGMTTCEFMIRLSCEATFHRRPPPSFFHPQVLLKMNVDKREIAPWREDKILLVTEIYLLQRAYVELIILNIQEKSLSSKFSPSGAKIWHSLSFHVPFWELTMVLGMSVLGISLSSPPFWPWTNATDLNYSGHSITGSSANASH